MSGLEDELFADLEGLSEGEDDQEERAESTQASSSAQAGTKRKAADADMDEDEEDDDDENMDTEEGRSKRKEVGSLVLQGGVKPAEELDAAEVEEVDLGSVEDVSKIARLDGSKRMTDVLKVHYATAGTVPRVDCLRTGNPKVSG